MKAIALALTLVISAVQTVGWVECCCVLICQHQNDPCRECAEKLDTAPRAACCDETHKPVQEDTRCAHVQPSSEVASHATPLPPVILDVVLELPLDPLPSAPPSVEKTNGLFSQARGSPPLHLLHSVLLI